MSLQLVNNPAYPMRSTERNGISTLIMLFRSLWVGFYNSLKNAKQRRTGFKVTQLSS
ncbi:hypothetical protein ABF234_001314 [Flavobacterium psychrophilum]